jgi:hypothetical protein
VEAEPRRKARVHRRSDHVLEGIGEAGDGEAGARSEPARSAGNGHPHVGTGMQRRERAIVDDLKQRTTIHGGMRKNRRAIEQVREMDVAWVGGRGALEMRKGGVEASREQHGRDRCTGARCGGARGCEVERVRHRPVEARLPQAAVAATGKHYALVRLHRSTPDRSGHPDGRRKSDRVRVIITK